MKTTRRSMSTFGLAIALLVAACSGGPGGPGSTSGAGGTTGPGGPAATPPGGAGTQAPGRGTAGPGQSIASTAACDVLTADSIASIAGATVVTRVPANVLGIFDQGCLFELRDSATGATTTINLGIVASGGRAYYDTEIAPTSAEFGYTSLPGLGDVALNARAGSILAVAGDVLLGVQYFGPAGPEPGVAIEIARQVFANLGQ